MLDPGGLPDRDAGADERPGRRLIGRGEQDRTQATVPILESTDHRVALADGGVVCPVHIQRQDPGELIHGGGFGRVAVNDGFDHDWRVIATRLGRADRRDRIAPVEREGEVEVAAFGGGGVRSGREAFEERRGCHQ